MTFFQSIILGTVEGLTEFLPVSSTFHLVFASRILQIPSSDFLKLFEVVIQSGAILAIVGLYFKTLITDCQLTKKVFISFLPTALAGILFYKTIKNVFFESEWLILGVFGVVGAVFILFEKLLLKRSPDYTRTVVHLNSGEAVLVGVAQALAIVPGVSRAGAVILAMMAMGFRRDEAARYSFLLAVPTIVAASLYDLFKSEGVVFQDRDGAVLLIVGFLTALFSAYFIAGWFIKFLKRETLSIFGWYRILLSFLLMAGLIFF